MTTGISSKDESSHHHHGPGAWDDETAEWYSQRWGDHPTNRMMVELANLKPDEILLDIGCGTGAAVREAAERVCRGRAIGVDITPAMIRLASEQIESHPHCGRISFLAGPAENLPIGDRSVTLAWALNSMHHWSDPDRGLAEVRRVLVPGGRFIIGEEPAGEESDPRERELKDPRFVNELLRRAGFQGIATTHHSAQDDVEGEVRIFLIQAVSPPRRRPGASFGEGKSDSRFR